MSVALSPLMLPFVLSREEPFNLCLLEGEAGEGIVKQGTPRASEISEQRAIHVQVMFMTLYP